MENLQKKLFDIFQRRVYTSNFKELSGWDRIKDQELFYNEITCSFTRNEMQRYYFEGSGLKNKYLTRYRNIVARHFSQVEMEPVDSSKIFFTLGATSALSTLLFYLKEKNINLLIVDPPYYFSIDHLCRLLKIRLSVVKRNIENINSMKPLYDEIHYFKSERKALLISNPRYVISKPYPQEAFEKISALLDEGDVFIVDMAPELIPLKTVKMRMLHPKTFIIRHLTKSLYLNGCRVAVILSECDQGLLSDISCWLFGAHDASSLKVVSVILENYERYFLQVKARKEIIVKNSLLARSLVSHPSIYIPIPENGYLGYALVDLKFIGRFRLFQFFLKNNINATFTAQTGLSLSSNFEMVRINYFLEFENALKMFNHFLWNHCPISDCRLLKL